MTATKGVEAVDRALQILECFGSQQTEISLAELSRQTGQYKSTLLRLLVSLERFGYVVKVPSGRYRLGSAVWRLGAIYRDSFDLSGIMRPELDRLSAATNETASYFVREGDSRVCLFRSEPVRSIRHSLTVGARMPLLRGASGRVLRAFSGDPSPECEQVRAEGYSISRGERDPEVGSVAVPIIGQNGSPFGVVTLSGLVTRFTAEHCNELLLELRITQRNLLAKIA